MMQLLVKALLRYDNSSTSPLGGSNPRGVPRGMADRPADLGSAMNNVIAVRRRSSVRVVGDRGAAVVDVVESVWNANGKGLIQASQGEVDCRQSKAQIPLNVRGACSLHGSDHLPATEQAKMP